MFFVVALRLRSHIISPEPAFPPKCLFQRNLPHHAAHLEIKWKNYFAVLQHGQRVFHGGHDHFRIAGTGEPFAVAVSETFLRFGNTLDFIFRGAALQEIAMGLLQIAAQTASRHLDRRQTGCIPQKNALEVGQVESFAQDRYVRHDLGLAGNEGFELGILVGISGDDIADDPMAAESGLESAAFFDPAEKCERLSPAFRLVAVNSDPLVEVPGVGLVGMERGKDAGIDEILDVPALDIGLEGEAHAVGPQRRCGKAQREAVPRFFIHVDTALRGLVMRFVQHDQIRFRRIGRENGNRGQLTMEIGIVQDRDLMEDVASGGDPVDPQIRILPLKMLDQHQPHDRFPGADGRFQQHGFSAGTEILQDAFDRFFLIGSFFKMEITH